MGDITVDQMVVAIEQCISVVRAMEQERGVEREKKRTFQLIIMIFKVIQPLITLLNDDYLH